MTIASEMNDVGVPSIFNLVYRRHQYRKLTDLSNLIDVTLSAYDKKYRKHSFIFEAGIDHYTSASSDILV